MTWKKRFGIGGVLVLVCALLFVFKNVKQPLNLPSFTVENINRVEIGKEDNNNIERLNRFRFWQLVREWEVSDKSENIESIILEPRLELLTFESYPFYPHNEIMVYLQNKTDDELRFSSELQRPFLEYFDGRVWRIIPTERPLHMSDAGVRFPPGETRAYLGYLFEYPILNQFPANKKYRFRLRFQLNGLTSMDADNYNVYTEFYLQFRE